MEEVVKSIWVALEKNGFPEKKVRLPFKPIFKSCKYHGTTLSAVLNELKSEEILHEIDADRILFYHKSQSPPLKTSEKTSSQQTDRKIPDDLYAEAMKRINEMDPEEVERIKEQVKNMSPEEQAELLNQAQQIFKNQKS